MTVHQQTSSSRTTYESNLREGILYCGVINAPTFQENNGIDVFQAKPSFMQRWTPIFRTCMYSNHQSEQFYKSTFKSLAQTDSNRHHENATDGFAKFGALLPMKMLPVPLSN